MTVKISDINTESNVVNSLEQKLLKMAKKKSNSQHFYKCKKSKYDNFNKYIIRLLLDLNPQMIFFLTNQLSFQKYLSLNVCPKKLLLCERISFLNLTVPLIFQFNTTFNKFPGSVIIFSHSNSIIQSLSEINLTAKKNIEQILLSFRRQKFLFP